MKMQCIIEQLLNLVFVIPGPSISFLVSVMIILTLTLLIDHLRNRLKFDLNKSRQKFHHSLKEHHKISNIPKFRCEML